MCFSLIDFLPTPLPTTPSPTEKYLREENTLTPRNLNQRFSILKKCRCKRGECLIRDTDRFIRTLRSTLNTQTDATSAKRFFINLHFHRDTVSACTCQLDKFSFFANFRFKMFLKRFFHHKLNFKFAFLETQKKIQEKKKKWSFLNLISQLSARS